MMKQRYVYPDYNDEITIKMIDEKESINGIGYWQKSEKRILDIMKKQIAKYIIKDNTWFLDAGCGDGRLLPEFEKYFDNILLIDPDKHRLDSAKRLVNRLNLSKKVKCKTLSIESIESKQKFDVILCNHVIQHVHTDNVKKILEKFYKILKKEGLLFINTCNSTKKEDYFVKQFIKDSKTFEVIIRKEEFNSLVYNKKILPIHFFDKDNLINLLKNLNFNVLDFKKFHNKRDIFISLNKSGDLIRQK